MLSIPQSCPIISHELHKCQSKYFLRFIFGCYQKIKKKIKKKTNHQNDFYSLDTWMSQTWTTCQWATTAKSLLEIKCKKNWGSLLIARQNPPKNKINKGQTNPSAVTRCFIFPYSVCSFLKSFIKANFKNRTEMWCLEKGQVCRRMAEFGSWNKD